MNDHKNTVRSAEPEKTEPPSPARHQLPESALQQLDVKELIFKLEGLRAASELMMSTINQLRNICIEGSAAFKMADVDLVALAEHTCAQYRHIASRQQVLIYFESSPQTAHVLADRAVIAAALDRLVSYAVRNTPPGKIVGVEIKSEPHASVFSVQGQRLGFRPGDAANRSKMTRSSASGNASFSNHDLVLASDLITRIGGEMWCQSSTDAPARFSIRLRTIRDTAGMNPI